MPHNPFTRWGITGTWEQHAGYSLGGSDIPLSIGTDLPAPAAGTLRTSGGSGEFQAGYVGSAGRRSILELDTPIERSLARRTSPAEGEGPMVAIVFQHQSIMGVPGHYDEGDDLGDSGDSDGTADGGDAHLHWHGLNANGQRLRVESFITSSAPAGLDTNPLEEEDDMKLRAIRNGDGSGSIGLINDDGTLDGLTAAEYEALSRAGLLDGYHQEGDGMVWNILTRRTRRLRAAAAGDVDEAAIAKQVAPLVIGPILAALKETGVTLTNEQLVNAAETAIRKVFADASA